MLNELNLNNTFRQMLVCEANRWVGMVEQGGNNRGQFVQLVQKTVDGRAQGEAWCMAFVQFVTQHTFSMFKLAHAPVANLFTLELPSTEHCLTAWNKVKPSQKSAEPKVGHIVIWQHGSTSNGHTGIVTSVLPGNMFTTIEGNTADGKGIVRDGDGVYSRVRSILGNGDMKVLGFINPIANH